MALQKTLAAMTPSLVLFFSVLWPQQVGPKLEIRLVSSCAAQEA